MRETQLVDGERIKINLESVCFQEQSLIRIGPKVVVGAIPTEPQQSLYVWAEIGGVYQYLGNIAFIDQNDGSIIWSIVAATGGSKEFARKAAKVIINQGDLKLGNLEGGGSGGNRVDILSMPHGD